jgi:hypothetical protein
LPKLAARAVAADIIAPAAAVARILRLEKIALLLWKIVSVTLALQRINSYAYRVPYRARSELPFQHAKVRETQVLARDCFRLKRLALIVAIT